MIDAKNGPIVSVIMPVYNTAPYLAACLESVLKQEAVDFELIVIDDGSTDESPAILEDFARRDARIRRRTKKNEGQGLARNRAFEDCRGEFTVFVDSDDILHPAYLSTMLRVQSELDADAVYCRYHNFYDDKVPMPAAVGAVRGERTGHRKAIMNFEACPPLYLFRSSTLRAARLSFPGYFHEDEAEIFRLLLHCESIVDLNACLYYYRRHEGSTTGLRPNRRTADIVMVVERLLEIARDYPDYRLEFEHKAFAILDRYEGVWSGIRETWAAEALEKSKDMLAGLRERIRDNPYQFVREAAKREYENSLSWRLTRPLREVKRFVERI